ncbi:hypothetical protein [Parvibium lacunae]|uniref:Uncharacterized protein n=1 Tax=Parvibium lacunae TaxID=1888893 RepID=A0A368L4R9_9BURK|nr:hypothetical protein [Parvibium lacunae]RCS58581.1 hypothetical protein DU000_07180 [Parvibium lacunae]
MKLQLIKFKCAKCDGEFKAPEIVFDSYGEFLLRSVGNAEEAYLDAFQDKTYEEVDRLLKANPRMIGKKSNLLADILRKNYGAIACDPDSAGNPFQIGIFPKCPFCNSQEMEYWEETEPPQFVEKVVPVVTHTRWSALSDAEKRVKVDEVLSSIA